VARDLSESRKTFPPCSTAIGASMRNIEVSHPISSPAYAVSAMRPQSASNSAMSIRTWSPKYEAPTQEKPLRWHDAATGQSLADDDRISKSIDWEMF
jgi:hypothetical protein